MHVCFWRHRHSNQGIPLLGAEATLATLKGAGITLLRFQPQQQEPNGSIACATSAHGSCFPSPRLFRVTSLSKLVSCCEVPEDSKQPIHLGLEACLHTCASYALLELMRTQAHACDTGVMVKTPFAWFPYKVPQECDPPSEPISSRFSRDCVAMLL